MNSPFPTRPEPAIIIGTGPSLTDEQLAWARVKQKFGWVTYGVNNVYQRFKSLDVLLACNIEWWDYYYPRDKWLRSAPFDRWTWDKNTADKYGLDFVEGRWRPSLSKDPRYIHYGHASGYQILGIAYHYGAREMFLLGYDMAYPKGRPRHYFGEYPQPLQHWPKTGPEGEFTGLIRQFETIDEDDLELTVYNLTPNSALDHFQRGSIDDF